MTKEGDRLRAIVGEWRPALEALRPVRPDERWSATEILGHLIDSASNNHQRFVRAQLATSLDFPPYEQEGWVRVQRYRDADWSQLVDLWAAYNLHVAHVMDGIPVEAEQRVCRIGPNEPGTLGELVVDYIRHLEHHLQQITSRAGR